MKQLIYLLLVVLAFTACTKTFTDTNINPNQFASATPEAIMQGVVKRTSDLLATANMNYHWTGSHLLCIGGGSSRYGVGEDGFWETAYVELLGNLKQIETLYADKPGFENRVQIARIWRSYVYSILVGTYGPVPMKNALQSAGSSSIMFDEEDSVYTNLLSTLKAAGDGIDVTKDKLTYDGVYAGDLTKWKKLANTLRLKLALRCRRNLNTAADAHIQEVMANEALLINQENETAKMAYENIDGNQSPYFIRYVRNVYTSDIAAKMSDFVFTYLRAYKDPRLQAYYDTVPTINRFLVTDTLPSQLDDSLRIVTYTIPYFGMPKAPRLLPGWGITADPVGGLNILTYSDPKKSIVFAADKPFIHLSYAETLFMKAEAVKLGLGGSKTAEEYYNAGIDANFANWGISSAAAAYKAQDGIKFGTSSPGFLNYLGIVSTGISLDDMQKIWIQRWLNYFPDGGFDAWCLIRRTRMLDLPPLTNPANQFITETYADMPNRWVYPTTVINFNVPGYNEAVAKLGGDEKNPYINLEFLQPLARKDWDKVPAAINFAFIQKWYGSDMQQLAASGAKYTLVRAYKL